jgi:hypothetical protein
MIYDVLLKGPIFYVREERDVEISENLMTIKFDVGGKVKSFNFILIHKK